MSHSKLGMTNIRNLLVENDYGLVKDTGMIFPFKYR
jgi:hypothetical protein